MTNFIEKMKELIDTEMEINGETFLANIEEWDSLSFVSFLTMANVIYGKKVKSEDVRQAKTINDLYNLIK